MIIVFYYQAKTLIIYLFIIYEWGLNQKFLTRWLKILPIELPETLSQI